MGIGMGIGMGVGVDVGVVWGGLNTHIVLIEDTKDKRCKFTGIALWKELLIDFDKTLSSERDREKEGVKEKGK